MKSIKYSLIIYCFLIFIIGLSIFKLFPKHNQKNEQATISWDASGYYYYLPAIFIYHDLKHLNFKDSIAKKYEPTPDFNQAFKIENGNYVLKYSCGLAIQYLPSFIIGHFITKYFTKYPADGFSKPYNFSIAFGSFLITLLGLWYMRKILLIFYSDKVSSITLLTLGLTSNYLNYTAFDGAMSHNYLFTLYTLIIFSTIKFYESPSFKLSTIIGILVGLAALTRPTEIVTSLIPILWGTNIFSKKSILARLNYIQLHLPKYVLALVICIVLGTIQLFYWKYVSGHWLVYSYQHEGFDWLKPHILNGLFSLKGGWLIYTPTMFFALIGIYQMGKFEPTFNLRSLVLIYTLLFIYITFAWETWWYGGSLGQRPMVQTYALLCIPLGAFFDYILRNKWDLFITSIFWTLFLYLNLWWTYNYHMGGYFWADGKNSTFFWHTLGKLDFDENDFKLLDNNEGTVYNYLRTDLLYSNNFEQDTISNIFGEKPIEGKISYCIDSKLQYTPEFCFHPINHNYNYIRTKATFKCIWRSWDFEKFAQFQIRFKDHSNTLKICMVKLDRFFSQGETKIFFFDCKVPNKAFDEICIQLWTGDGNNRFLMDELKVEGIITK